MIEKFKKVLIPTGAKISKRKNAWYVQVVTKREYIKEKKYYKETKVAVGRVLKTSDDEKYMYPNVNYFIIFKNGKIEEINSTQEFSDSVSFGIYSTSEIIFEKIGLNKIFEKIFGSKAQLLKALVCYYLSNGSNTIQGFKTWLYKHYAGLSKIYSDSFISDFLNNQITQDMIYKFQSEWIKTYKELSGNNLENTYLNVDSTNISTTSKAVEMAEYGYSKDGEYEPIVNISFITDQLNGLPIYYDIYAGSINDMSQCEILIDKSKELGIKNSCLVMDRGYFSSKNVQYLDKNGYKFIMMAKLWNKNLQNLLEKERDNLRHNILNIQDDDKTFAISTKAKVFSDSNKEFNVVLIHDPKKEMEKVAFFTKYYTKLIKQLPKNKKISEIKQQNYQRYLDIDLDENGFVIDAKPNQESFKNNIKNAGYFAIISNTNKNEKEIIETYKRRDSIEKMFKWIKSQTNLNKNYSYTDGVLESKTFITFIASIVKSFIKFHCSDLLKNKSSLTFNSIIDELSKIEVSKFDEKYIRKNSLTAKQKEILKNLNISSDELYSFIISINEKIS